LLLKQRVLVAVNLDVQFAPVVTDRNRPKTSALRSGEMNSVRRPEIFPSPTLARRQHLVFAEAFEDRFYGEDVEKAQLRWRIIYHETLGHYS